MDDTTYVPINDVYYRRLFIPVMVTGLLFIGCFLIIRGSPGIEWSPVGGNSTVVRMAGGALKAATKYLAL